MPPGHNATSVTERSDEELMGQFQRGDTEAFSLLVRRYKDDLTNYVRRFMGDPDESDDIVQETFVRVFRKKNSYNAVAKFSTWLYTIATNLSKSRLRRLAVRHFMRFGGGRAEGPEFDLPDEDAKTDRRVEDSIREERIQKALDALPVKLKEVIVLRDIQDLSYEEIVAITGTTMGTIKSRISRAREQLRVMLQDIWEP